MSLNPPTQYADDANLRARQRLWESQQPAFDIVGWVLGLAGLDPPGPRGFGGRVLDVGCGNGMYLRELRRRGIETAGCDLSIGMLSAAADHTMLVNADAIRLPFGDGTFDVVLAPHMLYHIEDRAAAVRELRRVLAPGGVCVTVTNGADHMRALRTLTERAVRRATPDWEMRTRSTHAFSLDNGAEQLRVGFDDVECVRAVGAAPVRVTEAGIAADYVASVADLYQHETDRPWGEVVEEVRTEVQREIDARGAFVVNGSSGAFVCR